MCTEASPHREGLEARSLRRLAQKSRTRESLKCPVGAYVLRLGPMTCLERVRVNIHPMGTEGIAAPLVGRSLCLVEEGVLEEMSGVARGDLLTPPHHPGSPQDDRHASAVGS